MSGKTAAIKWAIIGTAVMVSIYYMIGFVIKFSSFAIG
jgi:hypothetical protein